MKDGWIPCCDAFPDGIPMDFDYGSVKSKKECNNGIGYKEKMKVRYIGESCISLTKGKVYAVLAVEGCFYRIVDDTNEDYLFEIDKFEKISERIVENE